MHNGPTIHEVHWLLCPHVEARKVAAEADGNGVLTVPSILEYGKDSLIPLTDNTNLCLCQQCALVISGFVVKEMLGDIVMKTSQNLQKADVLRAMQEEEQRRAHHEQLARRKWED